MRKTASHFLFSFKRGFGDKAYPPTIAPLVADPVEVENADQEDGDEEEEEEELDGNLPADPATQTDISSLSLQEGDGCMRLTEKEATRDNDAADTAEDENMEAQTDAEDSRTPRGTSA